MVAVQAAGCAPIVRAYETEQEAASLWENPVTRAWGLRVPHPLGDRLILQGVRSTRGTAIAVSESEMESGAAALSTREGIFACPEGGATVAALKRLVQSGRIAGEDRVILFNTGTGLKYLDSSAAVGQGSRL
jgi:threonine synthase